MAVLPPAPTESISNPAGAYFWNDWYTKLRDIVNKINQHNALDGLQGGTPTQRYHLTFGEKTALGTLPIQVVETFGDVTEESAVIPNGYMAAFYTKDTGEVFLGANAAKNLLFLKIGTVAPGTGGGGA